MRARVLPGVVVACGLLGCSPPATPPPPAPPEAVKDPAALANPRMGSGGFGFAFGSAFPGACVPNGLAKVGPDTSGPYGTVNFLHFSGYWDGDDVALGFSHLHLHGTGATDYGIISLMPSPQQAGPVAPTVADVQSIFQKSNEVAEPGFYSLLLDRTGTRVDITATTHAAHHRYTLPDANAVQHVVLDLNRTLNGGSITGANIQVDAAAGKASGWVRHVGGMSGGFGGYTVYFVMQARVPWTSHQVWGVGQAPAPLAEFTGTGLGLGMDFPAGPVELQVGLSMVSLDGARANLAAELPSWDFEGTRQAAHDAWNKVLRPITVYGGSDAQQRTFYSAFHHGFMMPSVQQDVDGMYMGHDLHPHQAQGFTYVTDLSLWDTYRTLHPLYILVAPGLAVDVVKSLHAMAREGGAFPKWPLAWGEAGTMIGASAETMVAETYVKGLTGFDAEDAWQRLRAAAMDVQAPAGGRGGRDAVDGYLTLHYVPAERNTSVSLTTEYSQGDLALSNLARALGHTDDADALLERSRGYRKLFDPATGFLRARMADGSLKPDAMFDPTRWTDDFAEANAWQSTWMAAHDVDGMAALYGGPDAMVAKLQEFFSLAKTDHDALDPDSILTHASPRPYFFQANEPDIHAPFMFMQLGRRDLGSTWIRWVRETFYNAGPDGTPGNDDGGTMGAWYVFAALGFYPLPGGSQYVLGVPMFPRVDVAVPGGTFVVEAKELGGDNVFIQEVRLNGEVLAANTFSHSALRAGGTLSFTMGSTPVH